MDYLLSEEQIMVRDLARKIAQEKLKPIVKELEEKEDGAGVITPLKPVKSFEPGEETVDEEKPAEAEKEEPEFEDLKDEELKVDLSKKSFKQLQKIAKKAEIETKGLRSKEALIKAIQK